MIIVPITKWAPDPGEGVTHRLSITQQANIIQFILLMKKLKSRVVKKFAQGHAAGM